MKKILNVLIISILVLGITSCREPKPKEYTNVKKAKEKVKVAKLSKNTNKPKRRVTNINGAMKLARMRGSIEGKSEAVLMITLGKIHSKELDKSKVHSYVQNECQDIARETKKEYPNMNVYNQALRYCLDYTKNSLRRYGLWTIECIVFA